MKNKSISLSMLLKSVLALLLVLSVFEACKKDPDPVAVVDKSKLKARIDSANAIYTGATEGVQVGSYEAGSKAAFKNYIDAATIVNGNTATTQADATNAYANLGVGMTNFAAKRVQEIAPDKLVLFLHLDNNALDASGKGLSGSLVAGASGVGSDTANKGGGMPIATADRLGQADKAYMFDKGGHIEIPYNSVLNPAKEMTIAMWVKPTVKRNDNYLVSLGRWYGYKLQLQGANKAFLTVNTGPDKYSEHDNDSPELELNKWYHIAVTYKSGEMVFYINGTPTKAWTDVVGDPISVKSNVGMSIGQDLPNALYTNTKDPDANGYIFFREWGGYFTGAMDEIRVYNAVLSGTQVKSIYNAEKP